jgi:hypothetical protein
MGAGLWGRQEKDKPHRSEPLLNSPLLLLPACHFQRPPLLQQQLYEAAHPFFGEFFDYWPPTMTTFGFKQILKL